MYSILLHSRYRLRLRKEKNHEGTTGLLVVCRNYLSNIIKKVIELVNASISMYAFTTSCVKLC